MDDTRIDAAPTPAHIFAYRAFRSVFVGSPESSPVRPPPTEPQHIIDNKENTLRPPARGSRFATSPVKSKRNAENVPENLNLSLTPKRQRTNPVSPTKSILKNPNIATPRRAELRDVTVTFKDVRMSVSPEMARRGSPTRARSQPDLRNTLAALSSVAVSAPVPRAVSASQVEGPKESVKNHVVPQVATDVSLDGYMAQTEKEMRRLIKYGQKWREYARKQEVETTSLKAIIEDLQKENERLRRKGDTRSENVRPSSSTIIAATSTQTTAEAKLPKQRDQPFDLENRPRNKEPEKWKIPLNNLNHDKQRSRSTSMLKKRVEDPYQDVLLSSSKDTFKSGRRMGSATKPAEEASNQSLMRRLEDNSPQQDTEGKSPSKEQIPSKQFLYDEIEDVPDSKPSFESSEGDRKAAARERLRLKREAKVASVRASSREDESQVDWMAMA